MLLPLVRSHHTLHKNDTAREHTAVLHVLDSVTYYTSLSHWGNCQMAAVCKKELLSDKKDEPGNIRGISKMQQ